MQPAQACDHGQLRRSCELCELRETVRELEDRHSQLVAERDTWRAEVERLRKVLDVIAKCPSEAVHLMPFAAQAALAGQSESDPHTEKAKT